MSKLLTHIENGKKAGSNQKAITDFRGQSSHDFTN